MAFVALAAMALSVGVPTGAVPPNGEFPMAWLWSWLSQRPAWSAFSGFDTLPKQANALGRDDGHYVPASETRASTGTGRDAGRAPGALDAATPLSSPAKPPWTTPRLPGPDSFDPKTSRKVSGHSNAGADTYQNADGSFTRTVSSGITNFRDTDGSWKPIDTSLVRRGGRLYMAANSVSVSVAEKASPSSAANGSLASVALPTGQVLAYGLTGAAAVSAVVSGSMATYPEILPKTDLEFVTLESGLKETLILKSPDAANSWVFPLRLDGLTPQLSEDGSIELRDAGGRPVAWIPAGTMKDSKFDPERGDMASSSNITYELVTVDGAPALKVTADRSWLADPARVYPVRVDPTTTTYTTADVFVDNDSSTDSGDQNGVDLTVGTFDDGATKARSFIRFDNFDDNGLAGRRITGARLKVYLSWTFDCNHPTSVSVYKITSNWTVANLSTSGLYGPSVSGPIGSGTPVDNYPACTNTGANRSIGEWHTISLNTATFNDWSSGASANYGLALIGPESGTNSKYGWKRYTAANYGSTYMPRLEVDWAANVQPQVNRQYPPSNYSATSLTPELIVDGKDPDAWPTAIKYNFMIYDKNGLKIAESGLSTARSWVVPSGTLTWAENYFWTVLASDGLLASTSQTMNVLSTPVPQPLVTSALSQNGGQGFDVSGGGNYTTSATDAAVPTVGPALAVTRSYNSRDPRVGTAFGAGWSSIVDAKATEQKDAAGVVQTVVVTYPTGQEVAFGRNADGTFTPPSGRFASFSAITGGYRLVDKDGTAYAFTGVTGVSGQYGLASLTDPQGRSQTFVFNGSGRPTTITSASGRSLQLTWSTPAGATAAHVATVSTDPATPGDPGTVSTWTYTYTGDRLTKLCPPTSSTACTTYTYTSGSLYPSTVLNARPRSYWRLGEASGTAAISAVRDNAGTDNGTYSNVTLGQPGPLPGSTAKAAGFNGTSARIQIPAEPLASAGYQAISLWFKVNSGDRGPLAGYSVGPITTTTTSGYVPALYVGTSGKLYGEFWQGAVNPIATTGAVTDGQWHHVVLSAAGNTQSLYLDGAVVGTRTGQVTPFGAKYAYIGAGFWGNAWPDQPNSSPAQPTFFKGSIAEAAYFDRPLTAENVALIRQAGVSAATPLASVVRPSGNASASMLYDGSTGDLTQVTDANGGVWHLSEPALTGSYQVHSAAVLGASPADYYRLAENGAAQAVNEVNGGDATYSGVTLGVAGGPFDGAGTSLDDTTVAGFDGTASHIQLPTSEVPAAGPNSVAMWFKVPSGNTSGGVLFGYGRNALDDATAADGPWNGADVVDILFGDLNNDGRAEVIKRSSAGELVAYPNTGGLGTTTFGEARVIGTGWNDPNLVSLHFADLNNDGKADVIGRYTNGELRALPNNNILGGGSWGTSVVIGTGFASTSIISVFFADLNNDGKAELIARYTDGTLRAWPNNNILAGVSWGTSIVIGTGWNGSTITGVFFAQLNIDGKAELIGRYTNGELRAWPNNNIIAGGSWGTSRIVGTGWNQSYMAGVLLSDLDGDDKEELIIRNTNGNVEAFPNVDGINFGWGAKRTIQGGWTGSGVPALYVGSDGKVHGGYWANHVTDVMTSTGTVNDGNWHHAVLAAGTNSQSLYVDGVKVATLNATLADFAGSYAFIGGGAINGGWPGRPATALAFFTGDIAEVSFYPSQLSDAQVAAQFSARATSSGVPVKTVTVTDPGNHPLRYIYDVATGRKVADIDALGNETQYGYDTGGFLHTVTDPMGNVTTTEQDVRGNTISSKTCQKQSTNACSTVFYTFYPDATTKVLTPDPRNDVMLTMRDGRSQNADDNLYKTAYAYDTSGNRTTVTDPLGRVTTTTYTTASTAAFGGGVTPPGLPMTMTTAGGSTQAIEYFSNGDVARITDPAGKVTTFTYDGLGRTLTKTETTGAFAAGLTTTVGYDKLGRVVSETSPPVTNRVTGAVHTAVSTTVYNVDGQTESQTVTDTTGGDAARTVSATYNALGQQWTSTDAAGKTTTYEYDAYGRVVREIGADGDVVESMFDAKGQLLTTTVKNFTGDPNAPSAPADLVVTSRAYDPAGRLATVTDAMGWQTLYDYTDNGLTAKVTRKNPATGATFVQQETIYNGAGQVTTSKTNNGATTTAYQVDAAGRTTQSTVDAGGLNRVTTQTYSADDFVINTTSGTGNAVTSTDTIYDALGRPVASTSGNGTVAPVGRWRLNDGSGTTAADGAGNSPAALSGGVTWSSDHGGSAVFDGIGGSAIATGGAVLDTNRSFTVSVWVKLNAGTTGNKTAVSQDGQRRGAFYLSYEASTDKWRMMMCSPHSDTGGCVSALSTSLPVRDTWTHLTGVYDQSAGKIRLYVNGAFEKEVSKTTAWSSAVGPLRIGRTKWNGGFSDHWPGSLSDVQAYQRVLTNTEIANVYSGSLPAAGVGVVRTSRVLDESGLPLSETDANGKTTEYGLDEAGRVAVVTRPAVLTESQGGTPVLTRPVSYTGYDTFGAAVETKNPNGNVTVTAYDAAGRVDTITMPNYTPPGSSTSITAVTSRDYNDVGQLITETDPLGKSTSYVYDQLGRVARVTTAELGVIKYTYDLVGDRLSATDPTGAVSSSTYDYLGRPLTSTQVVRQSGASYTTQYTYGYGGWLASTQSPAGVVTSNTYNAVGEPVTATDGANKTTTFAYDALGRRIRTTLPDNTYSTLTYDAFGRVTATSNYDAADTLLTTQSSVYDAAGNVTAAIDARNHTNEFTYDATGLLIQQVQPINGSDSIITSFGYDIAGNRTRFTDGRGSAFLTTYNSWGLPESQIEPETLAYSALADRTFTTSYDAAGRVASRVEPGAVGAPDDVVITYTYDDMGRLTTQAGTGAEVATADRTFDYDLAGRLISASAPGGTNSLTYDDRGLLLTATGGSGSSSFGYTPDGQMASRTDAAGTTNYTYDPAGRLATATNSTAGVAASFTYNDLSQISKITYGSSGNARWLGYNTSHRLVSDELKTPGPVVTGIASISYGWDENGNLTSKTTTGFAGSAANTYTYDWANRLTSWDNGTTPILYAYDKSGNRVQAGTSLFEYDERNQLKTASGNVVYGYTPRGTLSSVTTVGVSTLDTRTDAFGQIRTQFVTPTQQQDYEYDGLGRLVRPNASYTGIGNTLASDGTATYARDPAGKLLGVAASGTQRLTWTDLHTDVVAQFDATSTTLAASTTYEPFGKVAATASMIGSLGYQSEYTDALTGRVNMHARWYNPETGQFDTRDSVSVSSVPASVRANRFGYGDASPLVNTDPTGHCGLCSWLGGKVSQGVNATVSGAKSAWNATTSAVSTAWNAAKSAFSSGYNAARNWANKRIDDLDRYIEAGKKAVKDVVDKGKKIIDEGKKWVNEQAEKAKQRVKQVVNNVKQAGKKLVAEATRVVTQTVNNVKDAYKAAETWVKEHKDVLLEVAAIAGSVLAGVACAAVTAGVGALACMAGAAALINLAKDAGQGKIQNFGDAFQSFGVGALQGALGGAGGMLGGKIAGALATKFGGGLAARIGAGAIGGGLADGASGAAISAGTQLINDGRIDGSQVASDALWGAAFGAGIGGPFGARKPKCGHSFAPGTRVLMADGTRRPIEDVNIGDKVLATDPITGKTQAKPVTALHLNRDRDLTNVTVAGKAPRVTAGAKVAAVAAAAVAGAVLFTTQHHPFWDATSRTWTNAADLKAGQSTLVGPDGATQQVVAVASQAGVRDMRDLTVADTHTYYVAAGTTSVLVHNTNASCPLTDLVDDVHSELPPGHARNERTTAAATRPNDPLHDGGEGIYIAGQRDLNPDQRARADELGATPLPPAPGVHPEVMLINTLPEIGQLAANRPFCPRCRDVIEENGGTITSDRTAVFS